MPVQYKARRGGTLTADDVCQGDAQDDRPDSPKLLDCDRCGATAVATVEAARRMTRGWRFELLCPDCERRR